MDKDSLQMQIHNQGESTAPRTICLVKRKKTEQNKSLLTQAAVVIVVADTFSCHCVLSFTVSLILLGLLFALLHILEIYSERISKNLLVFKIL